MLSTIASFLVKVFVFVFVSLVVGLPIAFAIFWFKYKNVKKDIPDKVKKEVEQQRIKNEKEIQNWKEQYERSRGESGRSEGSENTSTPSSRERGINKSSEGKSTSKTTPGVESDKGRIEKQEGVQLPDLLNSNKNRKVPKRRVKLHKPSSL